jgi:acyl transferase domain-containing protein
MMRGLAELYVLGANVEWKVLHAPHARQRIALPPYPWQRIRYWPTASASSPVQTTRRLSQKSGDAREPTVTVEPDL